MRVELDVFSGVPNPSWTLEPDAAAALRDALARMVAKASDAQAPEALGYRGFVVDPQGELGDWQEIRVWRHVVVATTPRGVEVLDDPDSRAESILIAAAHLDDDIMALVRPEPTK